MAKVTVVLAGDWQGAYIDGKLVEETHRLNLSDVLNHLVGKKVTEVRTLELTQSQDDNLQAIGNLPVQLQELQSW